MTAKSEFTEDEWKLVSEGPVTAGMIVLMAQRGGSIRETFAMAKAYAEARSQHGESELLDELVAAKPDYDRHRYKTPELLNDEGMKRVGEASTLLATKATPAEHESYDAFVISLAERVAGAHREDGQDVSPAEQKALEAIRGVLGQTAG
jgi:hypothetical protein